MRLLTSKLPRNTRSAVRFVIVGMTGTALQYALYYGFLAVFNRLLSDSEVWVQVAFTLGFVLEMCINYVATSYYTFGSRPDIKNAGGFLLGRAFNYLIQMFLLWLLLRLTGSEQCAGMGAILIAGVINYFVLRIFFKTNQQSKS